MDYDRALSRESGAMYHFHVADDHPLFRNAILEVIKQHYPDAVVGQSMDLDSAIRDLEKNDETDLLLLDLMLPDMSGIEVCRRLRSNQDTAEVPVLMLTAKTTVGDRVEGLDAGADDSAAQIFAAEETEASFGIAARISGCARSSNAAKAATRIIPLLRKRTRRSSRPA